MTKNNALRAAAWLAVLIVANATPIGTMLQQTAAGLELGVRVPELANTGVLANPFVIVTYLNAHPEVATHAWLATFVVMSFFAWYMGRVFVGIWGDNKPVKVSKVRHTPQMKATMPGWMSRTAAYYAHTNWVSHVAQK